MQQNDVEWFRAKAGRFSGSRFSDLMAKTKSGPGAARKNLIATLAVERITGEYVQTFSNHAMRRGIELEPDARFAYEAKTGEIVDEIALIEDTNYDFVCVSPDGLIDDDGMVEIKCPSAMEKHMQALLNGSHAAEYRWQIQGQLWVADRQWCDAVSYDPRYPNELQLAITRVERDESAISELDQECLKAHDEVNRLVDQMQKLREAA